jgi:hypothetical protein
VVTNKTRPRPDKEEKAMLKHRSALTAFGAALLGVALAVSVQAWDVDPHTTFLTFSRGVEIPGARLAAGTYRFEVLAPRIVRVTSKDGRTVYLTAFTRDVERPRGLSATQHVLLGETPAGGAPPIRVWYPMSDSLGHELQLLIPGVDRDFGGAPRLFSKPRYLLSLGSKSIPKMMSRMSPFRLLLPASPISRAAQPSG